ncbi:MAG TPA: nuclear transport factor 2 family protein [Pseudonocardiaceae bacterium]
MNGAMAEAFSRHRFTEVYPVLADDVVWTVMGERVMVGREAVIAACEESAAYLAGVTTEFGRFLVVDGGNAVVVDTRATYTDAEDAVFRVSSCDVYEFVGRRLVAITSYTVATS